MNARWIMSLCGLLIGAATASASAQTYTYTGRFDDPANSALVASDLTAASFIDEFAVANNVAIYDLVVGIAGTVSIKSTGFGEGGIDPYFTLFQGSDGTATFFDSNYLQAFSTGGDFSYSASLGAGAYKIALGIFANMSFAENFGAGTLADGFVALGEPGSLGDGHYRLVVSTPVPEPSAWLLLASGIGGLAMRRRLRDACRLLTSTVPASSTAAWETNSRSSSTG